MSISLSQMLRSVSIGCAGFAAGVVSERTGYLTQLADAIKTSPAVQQHAPAVLELLENDTSATTASTSMVQSSHNSKTNGSSGSQQASGSGNATPSKSHGRVSRLGWLISLTCIAFCFGYSLPRMLRVARQVLGDASPVTHALVLCHSMSVSAQALVSSAVEHVACQIAHAPTATSNAHRLSLLEERMNQLERAAGVEHVQQMEVQQLQQPTDEPVTPSPESAASTGTQTETNTPHVHHQHSSSAPLQQHTGISQEDHEDKATPDNTARQTQHAHTSSAFAALNS